MRVAWAERVTDDLWQTPSHTVGSGAMKKMEMVGGREKREERDGGREEGKVNKQKVGGWEAGKVGGWEMGKVGGREEGMVGGWEEGKVGGWEEGKVGGKEEGKVGRWEEGKVGGREEGKVGGREEGKVGGWEEGKVGGWEEGKVGGWGNGEEVESVSSSQCSLRSNTHSPTPVPAETGSKVSENGKPGTERESLTHENDTTRSDGSNAVESQTMPSVGEYGASYTESIPSASMGSESATRNIVPASQSATLNTLASSVTYSTNTVTHNTSVVDSSTTATCNTLATDSTSATVNTLPYSVRATSNSTALSAVSSWEMMGRRISDMPLQTSNSEAILTRDFTTAAETSSDATLVGGTHTTSDMSLEGTAEGGPLGVKYSSSVDPPMYFTVEESDTSSEGEGSQKQYGHKEYESRSSDESTSEAYRDVKSVLKSSEANLTPNVGAAGTPTGAGGGVVKGQLVEGVRELVEGVTGLGSVCAVVKIQAWVRGVLCRRGVNVYRTRHRAATTIQSTW